jgi:hypothetical protein
LPAATAPLINNRVPGCTCLAPFHYPYDDPNATNKNKPIEEQHHELRCDLVPDLTGWLFYEGDDETGTYINPENLEEAYVFVNPDGVGDHFYLVRATVTKVKPREELRGEG